MAASDVVVRDAVADDLAWLVDCAVAMAWETERKRLDADIVHAGVAAALDDASKARYFVAMRNDARAGTLMLTGEWSDWRNGLWWWIQSVYVEPSQRRGGVFAALYRQVEVLARPAPGASACVCTSSTATRGARTYAALGMQMPAIASTNSFCRSAPWARCLCRISRQGKSRASRLEALLQVGVRFAAAMHERHRDPMRAQHTANLPLPRLEMFERAFQPRAVVVWAAYRRRQPSGENSAIRTSPST